MQPARWYVISDYPRNRSPYFSAIEKAAAEVGLPVSFSSELPSADAEPGVINLHRLKRLYRNSSGERDLRKIERTLAHLDALRANGFRLVWTLHNLYPIDGPAIDDCDVKATAGVLDRADMILCHTEADAASVRRITPRHVRVAASGWAGLPSGEGIGETTSALLDAIPDDRPVFLVLGNAAPYKEVRRVCETFLAATSRGRLVVAGPNRDEISVPADERLLFWNKRIEPSEAHHLIARASWAVCHYATHGRYEYFRSILFPSSVSAAVCAGVPVIAPDLPAVREISSGHCRILYHDDENGLARALAEADRRDVERGPLVSRTNATWDKWREILTVYRQTYEELCGSPCAV